MPSQAYTAPARPGPDSPSFAKGPEKAPRGPFSGPGEAKAGAFGALAVAAPEPLARSLARSLAGPGAARRRAAPRSAASVTHRARSSGGRHSSVVVFPPVRPRPARHPVGAAPLAERHSALRPPSFARIGALGGRPPPMT
eukprot:scaffold2254_cov393-Prasinococcus_capsulatus_cf.AAC.11